MENSLQVSGIFSLSLKQQEETNYKCQIFGFPDSSVGKESPCNAGDPGSISGLGRSPGEGNGNPFQYSCLENPIDRGAWQATVHGITRVKHDLAIKQRER